MALRFPVDIRNQPIQVTQVGNLSQAFTDCRVITQQSVFDGPQLDLHTLIVRCPYNAAWYVQGAVCVFASVGLPESNIDRQISAYQTRKGDPYWVMGLPDLAQDRTKFAMLNSNGVFADGDASHMMQYHYRPLLPVAMIDGDAIELHMAQAIPGDLLKIVLTVMEVTQ